MTFIDLLLVIIAITFFAYYRATCLRISNTFAQKAVNLMEQFYSSEEINDEIVDFIHYKFKFYSKFTFPLTVPLILILAFSSELKKENKKHLNPQLNKFIKTDEYKNFVILLWEMSLSRRPILWAISIIISALVIVFMIIIYAIICMFNLKIADLIRNRSFINRVEQK